MTNYRKQWQEQGYLVLPGALDLDRVARLHSICERVYDQWRRESEPGSEPGGHHYQPSAWSLLHINHAKYHREFPSDLAFVLDMLADPLPIGLIEDIFQDEAVFMQSNYYIDPPSLPLPAGWHRDCQFFAPGDEAKELADLMVEAEPPRELHMHIPLVKSAATQVVPGSHRRWDTPGEEAVRRRNPVDGDMPGALRLGLNPGDLAFFHVNTLHRGHYPVGVPRRTIAVSYGRRNAARLADIEWMRRFQGYACTYQPWFQLPHYLDGIEPATRAFFERFIEVHGPSWTPDLLIPEIGEKRIAYYRDYMPETVESR